MPTNKKQKAQRVHAKRRALERYGVEINRHDRSAIIDIIKSGEATLIHKQSIRVRIFSVDYKGTTYRVVYDRKRKELVTFLPPDTDW